MSKKSYAELLSNCIILLLLAAISAQLISNNSENIKNLFAAKGKTVKRDRLPKKSPVEITDLRIGDTSFSMGELLKEQKTDWLKEFSFKVRNLSNKRIVFFQVRLDFPETKESGPEMSHRLSFGTPIINNLDNKNAPLFATSSPINFPSGADFPVRTADKYSDLVRLIQTREPISNINKVLIRFGMVIFEDGTRWDPVSGWNVDDPQNPGRVLKIDPPALISYLKN